MTRNAINNTPWEPDEFGRLADDGCPHCMEVRQAVDRNRINARVQPSGSATALFGPRGLTTAAKPPYPLKMNPWAILPLFIALGAMAMGYALFDEDVARWVTFSILGALTYSLYMIQRKCGHDEHQVALLKGVAMAVAWLKGGLQLVLIVTAIAYGINALHRNPGRRR